MKIIHDMRNETYSLYLDKYESEYHCSGDLEDLKTLFLKTISEMFDDTSRSLITHRYVKGDKLVCRKLDPSEKIKLHTINSSKSDMIRNIIKYSNVESPLEVIDTNTQFSDEVSYALKADGDKYFNLDESTVLEYLVRL